MPSCLEPVFFEFCRLFGEAKFPKFTTFAAGLFPLWLRVDYTSGTRYLDHTESMQLDANLHRHVPLEVRSQQYRCTTFMRASDESQHGMAPASLEEKQKELSRPRTGTKFPHSPQSVRVFPETPEAGQTTEATMATLKSSDETLNDFFKSMAEVSEENKKWEEYIENVLTFWIRKASSTLQSVPGKRVAVKVYGSSAEGLKCCLPHDVGDVDLMIFPTAPETAITEEMLENIDGKPGFVRIYGTNHPVLGRFRKEHSDFVSTATLRKVHPEIFGQVSAFAKLAAKLQKVISGKVNPVLDNSIHHFVKTADGPAVTMNFAQSFEPLSEQEDRFRDERCYQNSPAALETIAASFCESRGVPYTRGHAELFNSYLEHSMEQIQRVAMDGRSIITEYPRLIGELLGGARVRELVQLREQLERDLAENAETGSAENENREGSKTGSVKTGSVVTCSDDTAGMHQKEDSCGLVNATGSSVSGSNERKTGLHDTESEAAYGGEASQPEPKARDNVGTTGDVSDASQGKFDPATLLEDPFVAHLFDISDTEGEKIRYSAEAATHDRTGGADFVPAFQGRGWPKLAEEWCSRLRKWPSHDVVEEVTRNGFHVVAKAPKTDGNPELDFRLSFSHAEYLLSQELSVLQKECYRCLKLYHRAFLRTEQDVLTSYHLKTVLLWTAEETDLTLWREENRGCCVLLLLGKLQEALSNKVLPHYFIRSCNLFEDASKVCPELLEMLSEKVESIRQDPTCFKWEMVLGNPEPCAMESAKEGMGEMRDNSAAVSRSTPAVLPGTATIDGRQVEPSELTSAAASPALPADVNVSAPPAYHPPPLEQQRMSYHDFQDLYLDTAAEIASLVLSGADVPTDDPVLGELEADMRAMCQKHPELTSDGFVTMFKSTTTSAYTKFQMAPSSADPIQRVLGALKGWMKMFRHCSDKELLSPGNEQAAMESLLDPRGGFDLGQVLPAGIGVDLLGGILNFLQPTVTAAEAPLPEDIPLD